MVRDSFANSAVADIRLRGVSKVFGDTVTVHPLDLEVFRGEFLSLLGPSGCGKTTTLRMIAGLEEPTAGDIEIQGQSMAGVPVHRRPTNLVFQKLALFPHLNVADNIGFGLALAGVRGLERTRRVGEMLDLVRLPGFEQRSIASLSGGQQQRVAIARALVNRPAVLLLDEPLGALDLQLQLHMQRELARIQRELGTTFVYVTHNQGEALAMSDRVAVMNAGRIEQLARPADLFRAPASRFVAEFMGQTNILEGTVTRTQDSRALVEAGGLQFWVDASAVDAPGSPATLSIRPERMRLAGAQAEGIRLVLKERVFQGAAVHYRVGLPTGGELLLNDLAPSAALPEIGDLLPVTWSEDAAIVVPGPR